MTNIVSFDNNESRASKNKFIEITDNIDDIPKKKRMDYWVKNVIMECGYCELLLEEYCNGYCVTCYAELAAIGAKNSPMMNQNKYP